MVGLYLNPPARAVVFSFDEKTQCQALDRTQPSLPMKPGRAGTMTHDYKRNGTIDLFAAMNLATGEVAHRPARNVTPRPTCCDSSSRSTQPSRVGWPYTSCWTTCPRIPRPEISKWLAHRNRRRWHLHFTPTSSSWLNLIERWFKELTDKRLRRGRFTSVADLTDGHHHLGRALEHRPQAIHLESHRRGHHRQDPTRPRRTPPDQIADGPLASPRPTPPTLAPPPRHVIRA